MPDHTAHAGAPHTPAAVARDTVTVDNVRSRYLHAGPADRDEAVVFVHGNPGPAEDWRPLVARAGAFARAIAPDMPGYGAADKPAAFEYTVGGYARHLGGILNRLGVAKAHLVLHDFGGPWGLCWAADHRDRLASLTLVNTGVLRDYRWHYLARIWRTPVLGEMFLRTATPPAFRLLLRHGNPRGLPRKITTRMYRAFKERDTQRAVLRLYRATDLAVVSDTLHPRLRGLDRPVLVVWGAHDPYLPRRYAERQRETFPAASVVVLDDSGHWPMHDHPDALEGTVLAFLRRATTAAHGS